MKPGKVKQGRDYSLRDEDTRLMVAFGDGSQRAFERLVRRNQSRIFRLAKRYLGDHAWAEDITQDVFVRVFNAAENYQPTAKFSTWAYRITVNLCLNALRDRKGHGEVALDGGADGNLSEELEAESVHPSEGMEAEELSEAVSEALSALPESQRSVLVLRRYEDLSYDEIAEVTGKPATAVKSLLARARQNLKSLLGKYLRE